MKRCVMCKYAGFVDGDRNIDCFCLKTSWNYTEPEEEACEHFIDIDDEQE